MLRISMAHNPTGPTIKLEGRLVGPWVQECQSFWQSIWTAAEVGRIQVDLKGVTSIDEKGKALLQEIHQRGGAFVASGCLTKAIVEDVTSADEQKDH